MAKVEASKVGVAVAEHAQLVKHVAMAMKPRDAARGAAKVVAAAVAELPQLVLHVDVAKEMGSRDAECDAKKVPAMAELPEPVQHAAKATDPRDAAGGASAALPMVMAVVMDARVKLQRHPMVKASRSGRLSLFSNVQRQDHQQRPA